MKKILFICPISLKELRRGTPLRIFFFLKQIKKHHQIYVSVKEIDRKKLNCHFIPYPSFGGLKQVLFFYKIIQRYQIDIILTSTETAILLPVMLKFICRVKIAIDLHGIYAEELFFSKRINLITKVFYELRTKFNLRFYDLIFVVSDNIKNYYFNVNHHIKVIHGGVETKRFPKKLSLKRRSFVIGYMGNARRYQGLGYLLSAAREIKEKNLFPFKLNLVISDKREQIRQMLKKYHLLKKTILHFSLEHDQALKVINQSSVLVIPRPSIPVTEYAYPSKLPEYLATGIPSIITKVGPTNKLLGSQKCCLLIEPSDVKKNLVTALAKVNKMTPAQRKRLGRKAINFAKNNLTWDILGEKISHSLAKL